jgi:glutamate racemase
VTADSRRPIGVFDSGAGGLTVVRALLEQLPHEQVVYFGDTAYVPYGPRPPDEIRRFALDATRFLCGHNVKLIVMGCNMSSAMALEDARRAAECPVLGTIEAGARMAVEISRTGRIGVAATEGTVGSRAYQRAVTALRPGAEVIQQACPLLVPAIEAGVQDGQLDAVVADSLAPLRDERLDTLILGCTHYPLLRGEIQRFMGPDANLVDPAEALAGEAANTLRAAGLLARSRPDQSIVCYASGPPDSLTSWSSRLLRIDLGHVGTVDIHQGSDCSGQAAARDHT